MDRNEMLETVGRNAQTAIEKGQAALADAADRLSPYVEQATDVIGPIAATAAANVRPALREAQIRGARAAALGLAKVQPAIDEALRQAGPAADAAVKRVAPAVEEILHRIPPSVEAASGKLKEDLLPKLSDTLAMLAEQPLGAEVRPALAAATAAVSAELVKPGKTQKKHSWGKRFGILALVLAIGGIAYAALKKALEPPDAGWVSHTPADAYIADPTDDESQAGEPIVVGVPPEAVIEEFVEELEAAAEEAEAQAEADEQFTAEEPSESGDASPFVDSPYGPGSYVGDEPPQGYDVKGNARSMKYHLPGQVMYARTTAEVWFDSAEAAELAGFSPVTR